MKEFAIFVSMLGGDSEFATITLAWLVGLAEQGNRVQLMLATAKGSRAHPISQNVTMVDLRAELIMVAVSQADWRPWMC